MEGNGGLQHYGSYEFWWADSALFWYRQKFTWTREGLQQFSLLKASNLVSQSAETERKELTIENPFVNTCGIQGMLYSMYYITRKLYAIQIGINPHRVTLCLVWKTVKGTRTANSHMLEDINKTSWKNCYIPFLLSSFYWLSQCSNSTPDVYIHFILIILPHVTLSTFILISGFKCFSIVPNFYMHSHLPFHMLSLFFPCALTLFMTFSELLWHFIFLWFILVMLPTYPNTVYKLLYLLSSSSVCKLTLIHLLSYLLSKSSLYSKVFLFYLVTLLVLW